MTRTDTPAGVWDVIARLEDARRELYATEKQANADTRWWLLLPIVVLCALLVLVGYLMIYLAVGGHPFGGVVMGIPACALLIAPAAWLTHRLVAPRRPSLPRRRALRSEIEKLEHRLDSLRAHDSPPGRYTGDRPVQELIERLESARHEVVDLTIRPRSQIGWRYVIAMFFAAVAIVFVILVGVAFPLSTGRFYGLLGVAIPMLVLLAWLQVRLVQKFDEPRIIVQPRRVQLQRVIAQLGDELLHVEGGAALHRQPSAYTQVAWRTFASYAPEPADTLRRLPADTSQARLWFHRRIGWGVVAGLVYAVGVLTLYMSLA